MRANQYVCQTVVTMSAYPPILSGLSQEDTHFIISRDRYRESPLLRFKSVPQWPVCGGSRISHSTVVYQNYRIYRVLFSFAGTDLMYIVLSL